MKLITNNPNPQPPDTQTQIAALLQRAVIEVENAPASYFGAGFYLDEQKEQSNATNQNS